jgi:hypothetical protein
MNPTIAEQHPPVLGTYADRNLALLQRLVGRQVDNPDRFAAIPEGATVVIFPLDDSGFLQHNLGLVFASLRAGQVVCTLLEENLDAPDPGLTVLRPAEPVMGFADLVESVPSPPYRFLRQALAYLQMIAPPPAEERKAG